MVRVDCHYPDIGDNPCKLRHTWHHTPDAPPEHFCDDCAYLKHAFALLKLGMEWHSSAQDSRNLDHRWWRERVEKFLSLDVADFYMAREGWQYMGSASDDV